VQDCRVSILSRGDDNDYKQAPDIYQNISKPGGITMSPKLEENISMLVSRYTTILTEAYEAGALGEEGQHVALGALNYLVDPSDLIPDDVPNIGLLDDLYVLMAATGHLITLGCELNIDLADHEANEAMMESKKGLLYGSVPDVSVHALVLTGKRAEGQTAQIFRKLKEMNRR